MPQFDEYANLKSKFSVVTCRVSINKVNGSEKFWLPVYFFPFAYVQRREKFYGNVIVVARQMNGQNGNLEVIDLSAY